MLQVLQNLKNGQIVKSVQKGAWAVPLKEVFKVARISIEVSMELRK